ncbi:hypothetical protein CLAFUW4_09026 [Fulvia fulva]|uniref:Uncharacterized protein n=1 Tax=Passalora fulva TaxID=5499 RepID=A0A9Q8PFE8_PASFU|nr:uncharacterized protein CLAFUR5_09135 [Fulvia fulva]KAK4613812.1 hypothetical protein CLAFUR4_09032 [Fulvia fulva]KAK4615018.1 hypothetical protein CLAFUR0_09024 [Fulvia fulva]UJO21427.1 hypothetical protein CLAFUR5_09135 [Fulvia fulva]WPV20083.1 hypothetical protein CLAFUW4_09026 [Fulvia fulva]WPV35478.1 hypothetical protein CLAFUW7_09027 [Fulvia fulva]
MMDGEDDFEVDPAIAAAMGFAGFGTQPSKKRKFNKDDGFVDPEGNAASTPQGTSANRLPLGEPKAMRTVGQPEMAPAIANDDASSSQAEEHNGNSGPPSLEALRHGVKNERGDTAYFLPGFIEDPWAGLKAQ